MKKIIFVIAFLLLLVGCGKNSEEDIVNKFVENVQNSTGYQLTGNLEIYRNEELYTYSVDAAYQAEDNFRVRLVNQTNNHEQIILKNKDGVYVMTHQSTYLSISLKNSLIGISNAFEITYKNSKLNV